MAEISFGGLATGLPTEDLVESLMAIERRPLDRLEADKEYETNRLKAYEQFNDLLGDLRSAAGDLNLTSEVQTTGVRLSSDEDISAQSSGAAVGSYDIAVAQLAQVQKTVTNGFSSKEDDIFSAGTMTIGTTEMTIEEASSLEDLASAINSIADETGVNATIINDGNDTENYHLVLSGQDASTSFSVSHTLTDANGDSVDLTTNDVRTAQQAIAYVDGIEILSNTNTLTGVIAGVTINLNQESEILSPASGDDPAEYKTTTLNVEADTEALSEKISTFVSAYNGIMEWIVSGYEEQTDTSSDDSDSDDSSDYLADYLRGDATINDVKRNLQSILTDAVGGSGSLQILSEVGITTNQDGTLNLNSGTLNTALETKFEDVVSLLAGDDLNDGVMKKFNAYLLDATSTTNGMYAEKQERYDNAVDRLDAQISQKEALMDKIETRIRAQFNAMELLVSELNSQSDYLTQQMEMLANLSSGDN